MNNKGISAIGALAIILVLVLTTFVGVWAMSMISTDPPYGGGWRSYRSGPLAWGDVQGTLAMDFELTETVQINHTSSLLHWSATDDVDGLEFRLTGRITLDVADVEAPGVLNFEQKTFIATRGTSITYRANALETKTLTPGWYKYVMVIWWDPSGGAPPGVMPLMTLTWRNGLADTSTAGHVYPDYVYVDHNRDGQWESLVNHGGTVAFHLILDGYILGAAEEPAEEEIELVSTGKRDDDKEQDQSSLMLAVGLVLLILGLVLFAVGMKATIFLEIIGFIFIIIATLMLAWSSYVMLTMSIGLMMAKPQKKDTFWKKEKVPKRVKVNFFTRRKR